MASVAKQQKSGVWTEEEDTLLALWQGRVGNRWSEVAKHMSGKTGQQCAQRWRHRVNPNISREKWSSEEDDQLATLVQRHGNSWAEIARRLPGRTDQQCMGRWRRHLDPSIRREGWEAEEDEQLRELYAEYGSSWSCISKSMNGRTAQQCRARWCQLSNAERPSRSSASRTKCTSTTTAARGTEQDNIDTRRQSTANTYGGPPAAGVDPMALFAAASAEDSALAAVAVADVDTAGARPAGARAGASRRLSTVSEKVGINDKGWSQENSEEEYEEQEEEKEGKESPEFMLRRTTVRTPSRASRTTNATAEVAAAAAMGAAGLPLPKQQHHHLQPPLGAASEQQVSTPPPSATIPVAAPAVMLPEALLPLKLELPIAGFNPIQEEDSPALTHNAGPHAAMAQAASADLLSPLRCQLPPAPLLFTPSSSGRKRSAAPRMATFGPTLLPLVIPADTTTAAARADTPVRTTPGSAPMFLELRSPNVLTLLQSPPALMDDLFRSPGFGSMLTPHWAKTGSSIGSARAMAAALAAAALAPAPGEADEDDHQQSVARRLDSAPSVGDVLAARAASVATAPAAGAQQQQSIVTGGGGSLPFGAAFDFGTLLGSPPKKSKFCSPGVSSLTAATVATTTPWEAGLAADGLLLQQHSESGGGTSLAMAVQQHLLLASTAKAGSGPGDTGAAPNDKENGLAARQLTLTSGKPPEVAAPAAAASPSKQLTSSNVRMRLHALLDSA